MWSDSKFPRLEVTVNHSRGSETGRMVEKQRIKAELMTESKKLTIDCFCLSLIVMHWEVINRVVM